MSHDVNCPYCGAEQEINHDDDYGMQEHIKHQQECDECGKNFVYETSIVLVYETFKADCLNGMPHDFEPVIHYPKKWPDWRRCKRCDYNARGKYKPDEDEEVA